MHLPQKLAILADAAKYDASCASSGGDKRNSAKTGGIGSTEGMGICHSYTPDGRCVSLLKILLTNFCIYDCAYCVNRVSSNVRRARFTTEEVVNLTLDFYKRNYIEGLFLSSGIIRSGDYTMEEMIEVARSLREDHRFAGYIHLKTIPEASPDLLALAGRYADRLSINIELPTEAGLKKLAPEKTLPGIHAAMGELRWRIDESKDARKPNKLPAKTPTRKKLPRFAPAGQSTQMIVGADDADDRSILKTSSALYGNYQMRRVYYSGFSPIQDASSVLPVKAPPLLREHRLYQADWLLRFYDFGVEEIAPDAKHGGSGMLDLDIDPKLAWALRHPEQFPVNLNTAPRETMLRVPGLGVRNVERILSSRRFGRLRIADLARLRAPLQKVLPFVQLLDHHPHKRLDDPQVLRQQLAPKPRQADLFAPGMSASANNTELYTASIAPPWDLDAWRDAARAALRANLAPECIAWGGDAQAGLLSGADVRDARAIQKIPNVSSEFFALAAMVLCHSDSQRHALLYRIAWRMASGERHLFAHATDPDIHQANRLAKSVGRDTHKMKAFVRFKAVPGEDNAFIAWFEPEHWIVDRIAPFFARRFAGMRWAILTPYRSVAWDGQSLSFSTGAQRSDAPIDDAREDLWRTYYANIFNPARLNPRMMRQEMPQKYWKHLPEAHLLPELIQTAGQRVREMAERAPEAPRRKIPSRSKPEEG